MGNAPGAEPPPYWVAIHLMAKDYGIPPWQVEEECPAIWYKQWSEYRAAEAAEADRLNKKAERASKGKGHA